MYVYIYTISPVFYPKMCHSSPATPNHRRDLRVSSHGSTWFISLPQLSWENWGGKLGKPRKMMIIFIRLLMIWIDIRKWKTNIGSLQYFLMDISSSQSFRQPSSTYSLRFIHYKYRVLNLGLYPAQKNIFKTCEKVSFKYQTNKHLISIWISYIPMKSPWNPSDGPKIRRRISPSGPPWLFASAALEKCRVSRRPRARRSPSASPNEATKLTWTSGLKMVNLEWCKYGKY